MDSIDSIDSSLDAAHLTKSLNVLRARRQWLETVREFYLYLSNTLPEMINLKHVLDQVAFLQEKAAEVRCHNFAVEALQKNAINSDIINSCKTSKEITAALNGIQITTVELENSITNDYESLTSLKAKYLKAMDSCRTHILKILSTQKPVCKDDDKRLATLQRTLLKLNLTRTITFMLIAAFCRNTTNSHLQSFRSSLRRDLTLEDFQTSWNLGM